MSNNFYIDSSSSVKNVKGKDSSKIYKECRVDNSCLGYNTIIADYSKVSNCILENNVILQRNSMIFSTEIGEYTYTGRNFTAWHCKIGKYCSISWNVSIGGANHDYERVTTHAMLYSNDFGMLDGKQPLYNRFNNECVIGNDVWLAANSTICRGVTIGDGAVVAAGAVVTKDVAPYTIVAGVPAKPIKKRFDDETIDRLLKIEWWDFDPKIIKSNIELFAEKMDDSVLNRLELLKAQQGLGE